MSMRQYRSELRTPSFEVADLSWDIGAGYVRNATAKVQDVSRTGMGLLVFMPFAIGTKLQITRGTNTRSAIVRRCIRQGSQHLLGVQFER
jgi:hypothetical protein